MILSRWLLKKPAKLESEIIWWSLSSPVPGFMICIHFRASPLFFALLEVIFFYLITELAGEEVQEMEVNLMQTMQERGECQQKGFNFHKSVQKYFFHLMSLTYSLCQQIRWKNIDKQCAAAWCWDERQLMSHVLW